VLSAAKVIIDDVSKGSLVERKNRNGYSVQKFTSLIIDIH